jgi:hypothetical protein
VTIRKKNLICFIATKQFTIKLYYSFASCSLLSLSHREFTDIGYCTYINFIDATGGLEIPAK